MKIITSVKITSDDVRDLITEMLSAKGFKPKKEVNVYVNDEDNVDFIIVEVETKITSLEKQVISQETIDMIMKANEILADKVETMRTK